MYRLKAFHVHRMIIQDTDIGVLVRAKSHMPQMLKLSKCLGFTGLLLSLIFKYAQQVLRFTNLLTSARSLLLVTCAYKKYSNSNHVFLK